MSNRLYVSTRKGLFTVDRGHRGWRISRAAFLGDNVTLALPDSRDGTLYAALDHGHFGVKLQRSSDAGETWEEVAVPAYPEKPEKPALIPDSDPPRHDENPWKLIRIWALEAGHPDQPGLLWCGTIPGGLFRSGDRGESFEMVRSLWDHPDRLQWFGGGAEHPGIHSILVDPRDAGRIAVGVSCGGVWLSEDGGATWSVRSKGMRAEFMPPERQFDPRIQDPHCVVWCPEAPDRLWAQHHNGIFKSTDAGASWSEIEKAGPSTFGFPVAVHPRDPDTAWFVPARKDEHRIPVEGALCVTRTRDGGRTFDVLRKGLPQDHAYDLVLRHALDVDETGDRLAFGSTTGSLYVSEDQGDVWQAVSEHLPPIYAVCFG